MVTKRVIAKEMERGVARRSLRSKRTPSKHNDSFMRRVVRGALTMVYLNPDTKIGREYYIEKIPRYGWVFNRGQARSTYHFHSTKQAALKEMEEYAERHHIKFNPGRK